MELIRMIKKWWKSLTKRQKRETIKEWILMAIFTAVFLKITPYIIILLEK